jgi:hypothetical protein
MYLEKIRPHALNLRLGIFYAAHVLAKIFNDAQNVSKKIVTFVLMLETC